MWTFASLIKWVSLFLLTRKAKSFLTARVEMIPDPTVTGLPSCSSEFIYELEGNLTMFVTNATQKIGFLSDFDIPSGLFLAYFDNTTSQGRRELVSSKKKVAIMTCNSAGCTVSVGICLCRLCGSNRRLLVEGAVDLEDATNSMEVERVLAADWTAVGVDVTNAVQPLVRSFVAQSEDSDGCLGNPNKLTVNVSYLSDLPFSSAMEQAVVMAFGATMPPVSAPTPQACCTQSFATCIASCGTTQAECLACSVENAEWLPQGPPDNPSCIHRGDSCLGNTTACCAGLSCVGDQSQQQCVYSSISSTFAPSQSGTTERSPSRAPITLFPTLAPSRLPSPQPTPLPTTLPTQVPSILPTPVPSPLPTNQPTQPPTYQPSPLPTSAPLNAVKISVGSDGSVAAVDASGNLHLSNDNGNSWSTIGTYIGTYSVQDVAVVDSTRIYMVGSDANVYRWNVNTWNQIGIYSTVIAATASATVAVVNSQVGSIWVKSTYDNAASWSMVPSVYNAKRVALVGQESIYYLTSNGSVYRTTLTSTWPVYVGHSAVEISGSSDGTVVVVSTSGQLWQKRSDDNTNSWFQIPGTTARTVAVLNKNARYVIDTSGNVQMSGVFPRTSSTTAAAATPDTPVPSQSPTASPTPQSSTCLPRGSSCNNYGYYGGGSSSCCSGLTCQSQFFFWSACN